MSTKKEKYHIAIDSEGYMIKGTPLSPARKMSRQTVFGNRFASGDRSYTDFSIWWYWAQTDWSGGFKDNPQWLDDAKYYYSTNIDTLSEIGAIKLANTLSLTKTFPENITCGVTANINGAVRNYIGTDDAVDGECKVYSSIDYDTPIFSSNSGAEQMNSLWEHKSLLWASLGANSTEVVQSYGGVAWTDHTAAVNAACANIANISRSESHADVADTLYVAVSDNAYCSIVSTADAGSNWSEILDHQEGALRIVDMVGYNGDLYYLMRRGVGAYLELWVYDISATANSMVKRFYGASSWTYGNDGRLLHSEFGKLIVTVPTKEIWEYDGSVMTRVFKNDDTKALITDEKTNSYLSGGGLASGGKIYWDNLVYDGQYFSNFIKNYEESITGSLIPLFVDDDDNLYFYETQSASKSLYSLANTSFKKTAGKNRLILSEMEEVSTIDKLANAIRIIFKPFDVGEVINIYYSTDSGENYTLLGTASYALDGTSTTQKTFEFDGDTSFRKLFIMIDMDGDGTSTPSLLDISLQYLPTPDYRYQWALAVNATDNMNTLDNQTRVIDKGIDIRNKLRASFISKTVVDFEDIDYHETLLNETLTASDTTITVDNTDGFPEAGRFKIEQEEINYTGKTATDFTGCTRGYRGTTAVAHADNSTVSTKYRVLITDFEEEAQTLDGSTALDYIIKLTLTEV